MAHFVTIGSGAWATTLANIIAENGNSSQLLVHDEKYVAAINETHSNPFKFKDITLSKHLSASTDVSILNNASAIIMALPTIYYDRIVEIPTSLIQDTPILNCSKGLIGTHPPGFISDFFKNTYPSCSFATLSGPNLAGEIILKKPAAAVVASHDKATTDIFQKALHNTYFRVYSSQDVKGVEFGGIIKNVYAIASGCIDGLELGYNAKSSFLCRAIEEMKRLGEVLDIRTETLFGLSGLGDLITTCCSNQSRNYNYGRQLVTGENNTINGYAEGPKTAQLMIEIADAENISMPILTMIKRLISKEVSARDALSELMNRKAKAEFNEKDPI